MDNARCPYLLKRVAYRSCMANELYCPSNFQLREYCITQLHKICPFYLSYRIKQSDGKEGMTVDNEIIQ